MNITTALRVFMVVQVSMLYIYSIMGEELG